MRSEKGRMGHVSLHIVPIAVEDALISLSAILLDDAYFGALKANKRIEDGVAILDERLLIPFKARAYLDLASRKAERSIPRTSASI